MRHLLPFAAPAALLAVLVSAIVFWPANKTTSGTEEEPPPVRITVAALGDLLMHMPVVNSVYDTTTGTYDFGQIFAPIVPYISSPDYTVANLETRLAGASKGYCGYPLFNTPADLAHHLRKAGIDLLATANNHSLDMGWDGIVHTLDNIDAAGIAHIGTYRSPAEKKRPFIANVNGVKLAFLNYTASTNGIPVPPGREFAVNILEPSAAVAEAEAARKMGADLVIAVLHFGVEYQRQPGEEQRHLVRELCARGVDVIIGSHPHVVQPIERFTVQRGNKAYPCVVAYSLGNFISNQRWRYSDSGIILYLEIEKNARGAFVRSVRYLPVWVQKKTGGARWQYRVLPAHPAVTASTGTDLAPAERRRLAQVWEELTAHLNNPAQGIAPYEEFVSRDSQGGRSPGKPETSYKNQGNDRPGT